MLAVLYQNNVFSFQTFAKKKKKKKKTILRWKRCFEIWSKHSLSIKPPVHEAWNEISHRGLNWVFTVLYIWRKLICVETYFKMNTWYNLADD